MVSHGDQCKHKRLCTVWEDKHGSCANGKNTLLLPFYDNNYEQ